MLALSGCGGQSEHDGAVTAPDVPLGPCSELVLRASPRVVMSTASGSASGPVVLQRDGGFDVIAQFSGERDASLPTIQARRVSLVDGRSELKLGPLTKIGNSASGWTEAVTLEAGLGLCTTSTVAVIGTAEAGGYQPDWTASPGETSGACTGIVPLNGSLLTAMRSRVDDGSVGTVTTWSQGVLESERTPWPAPGGLDADVSLAPLTDGYASAAWTESYSSLRSCNRTRRPTISRSCSGCSTNAAKPWTRSARQRETRAAFTLAPPSLRSIDMCCWPGPPPSQATPHTAGPRSMRLSSSAAERERRTLRHPATRQKVSSLCA